ALTERDIPLQRKIHGESAGTDDGVPAGIPELARRRSGEGPKVEEAGAGIDRQSGRLGAAAADGASARDIGLVSEHPRRERRTGLKSDAARHGPILEGLLQE